MSNILVVGSINMDLVVKAEEIPGLGETLIGNEFLQIPGGKGANQAVTLGKLNEKVRFLGKLGWDYFGDIILKSMLEANIDTKYIVRDSLSTGIASISLDRAGNNSIIVIPGANNLVSKEYLASNIKSFQEADLVLFQLEIPIATVEYGLSLSKKQGKTTLLNPAPASDLNDNIMKNIDILIPNEHELSRLAKLKIYDEASIVRAARLLLDKGVKDIIVTLGSKGAMHINKDKYSFYPAFQVEVVDTTAAGDSFIGGFISSYSKHRDFKSAIEFGQKVAAITIQKIGAQISIPNLEQVNNYKFK